MNAEKMNEIYADTSESDRNRNSALAMFRPQKMNDLFLEKDTDDDFESDLTTSRPRPRRTEERRRDRKQKEKVIFKEEMSDEGETQNFAEMKVDIHYRLEKRDYFVSEFYQEKIRKTLKFTNIDHLRNEMVAMLNKSFSEDDPIVMKKTDSYIQLLCKYKDCGFQHWYKFSMKDQSVVNITYFRTIKQGHTISAHAAKAKKIGTFI